MEEDDATEGAYLLLSLKFGPVPVMKWKGRRPRSRMAGILAAKRDTEMEAAMRRESPTTPLSWSGGSGTSCSVCGVEAADSSQAVAKKNKKPGGGSTSKEPVVPVNESTPLKFRANAAKKKRIRRPAKKLMSSELQEAYKTFTRENMELSKQVETLRIASRELIEENARLEEETKKKFKLSSISSLQLTPETETMPIQEKGLHSNLPNHKVNTINTDSLVSEETRPEQQLQVPNVVVVPVSRAYAIDLNELPPMDAEMNPRHVTC